MAKKSLPFGIVNPNAAGIDLGSREHWVAIGQGKENVKKFGVFTKDLLGIVEWLIQNKVTTVAMESTASYWRPLFALLQANGLNPIVVNPSFIKNVQGKKTDMVDCQWIWQLHSVGLLPGSFQPNTLSDELRTYSRHRRSLIEGAARYTSKMQKALTIMNLHLPVVLSDITGKSGQAIIRAILDGERDGKKLAALAHSRVKASKERIAEALTGNWQRQHLFELQQCWDMYHFYKSQVKQCDERIDALLQSHVHDTGQVELVYEPKKKRVATKNDPSPRIAEYSFQMADGVDLLEVDGIGLGLLLTIVTEIGLDFSKFPTGNHFVSWLGLSPNKKITGGKVLSSRTKRNKHPIAIALRQSANTIGNKRNSSTPLSSFFNRIAYRKSRKVAITATARKLGLIIYKMVTTGESYAPESIEKYQERLRKYKVKSVRRMIKEYEIAADEVMLATS